MPEAAVSIALTTALQLTLITHPIGQHSISLSLIVAIFVLTGPQYSKISNSNHFPILIEINKISASTNIIKFNHQNIIQDFSKIQITTIDSISNSSQTIHSNNSIKINTNNRYVQKKYWDEICKKLFRLGNACRQKYFKSKQSRNPDSAKGLDNISYRMLLALPLEQIVKLVSLLNITSDNGVIPEQRGK